MIDPRPIAITIGDPGGVGPEILLRAVAGGRLDAPFVVYGEAAVLEHCQEAIGTSVDLANLPLAEVPGVGDHVVRGEVDRGNGAASFAYLQAALAATIAGECAALVTLPVNKEAIRLSVPDFSGHTGVIAAACGVSDYTMALVSDELIATHVSTHVSLREAIERVKAVRLLKVIELTAELAAELGRPGPVGVLGLNPHAGEAGAFGDEELTQIGPAIAQARAAGLDVAGPLPPDTAFYRARQGAYAALVCQYHDQGHLPMKTLGFDDTVNVTVGLPIVRTSVDHGTAFDIAWQGEASLGSFHKAWELAHKLSAP